MKVVDQNKVFKFKGLCPYCGADLHYRVTGCSKHVAKKFWKADNIESECQSEPEDMMSEEWDEWMNLHSEMPYVNQLPVDERFR